MTRGRSGKGKVRFDDSLRTVLSGDTETGAGASATWRQLLDLLGRGRIAADDDLLARLRALRPSVPTEVRAASARALAFAQPEAALVAFVAEDGLAVAAPLLRTATLDGDAWAALIPRLGPTGRSVLRGRRDLPIEAIRSLESFGVTDFALPYEGAVAEAAMQVPPAPDTPLGPTAFASLGEVARGLPVVAEALRQAGEVETVPAASPSQIADLVARIDAFRREQTPEADVQPSFEPDRIRFTADGAGVVRAASGEARAMLVGASLAREGRQGQIAFGNSAARVARRRRVTDGSLAIGGASGAAGSWRFTASPVFDPASGRFAGYHGTARRFAAALSAGKAADSLRQLVHELRTPSNAIVGFAELIDMQLLGAVPDHYRERATAIRIEAGDFLAAIDDLDLMARLESGTLEYRQTVVPVLPLLRRLVNDVQPLARARGVGMRLAADSGYREAAADDRLVERALDRLLLLLVRAATPGEALTIAVKQGSRSVKIVADTPAAFSLAGSESVADDHRRVGDRMLLGAAFAAALVQRLVTELGGSLSARPGRLTLRLPTASGHPVNGAPDQLR